MEEEYRSVIDWEGYYEVSNLGNVRSIARRLQTHRYGVLTHATYKGKQLYKKKVRLGYLVVRLTRNGIGKHFSIHRLVCMAFLDNPNEYSDVNHKDGIKTNNNLNNLEWCSRKQNVEHALKNKLLVRYKGEECSRAQLKDNDIFDIREMYANSISISEISKTFKVSYDTIYAIVKNTSWKHLLKNNN